jgi:hypothetical protein
VAELPGRDDVTDIQQVGLRGDHRRADRDEVALAPYLLEHLLELFVHDPLRVEDEPTGPQTLGGEGEVLSEQLHEQVRLAGSRSTEDQDRLREPAIQALVVGDRHGRRGLSVLQSVVDLLLVPPFEELAGPLLVRLQPERLAEGELDGSSAADRVVGPP